MKKREDMEASLNTLMFLFSPQNVLKVKPGSNPSPIYSQYAENHTQRLRSLGINQHIMGASAAPLDFQESFVGKVF